MNKKERFCDVDNSVEWRHIITYLRGFVIAVLALVTMVGQAQTFTWRIEGTVANAAPTDTLMVVDAEKQRMITTLQVKDGNIVPASGTLDEPAVCCITKQSRHGWIRFFVLESGTVNLTVDLDLVYLIRIGGTPMNDELMGVLAIQNTDMDMDTYVKKMCEVVSRIVSNHPDHPLSPFLIGQSKALFTSTESIGLIEKLSPDLQASPKMDRLKNGPKQDNTTNLQFAIRQIDVDTSGTTISFRYYGSEGYWFRIAKDSYLEANGKKFNLKEAYGITLDENNYPKMKASAITDGIMGKLFFTDFTLTFEPFDTIPETLDFKEGDGEGAFVIRNVSIEKQRYDPIRISVWIMDNAPSLPTNWLMPLSNAPQYPRFQKSEQETAPATSDFWNPTLTAHMMVLDFRNPDKKG